MKKGKKALIAMLGIALVFGIFIGIEPNLKKQEPIILETVSDTVSESSKEKEKFDVAAKAAVLIDADTGRVLYQKNSHEELPFASVTKVMTMLLVMEAIEEGKINLDDEVTISERAASMGGSQMYMEFGEKHTVEELLRGVAMVSANDGCVALAEHVAGSEEIFVERMNQRAKELGMTDTNFVNTNGLPVAEHYSSAYDIAVMSKELYRHEKTHEWFTTWQSTITVGLPGKEKEFGLTNTNKMIKQYSGCNGIKTGYTQDAGYCLSASATRGNTHFIAVALGCETSAKRNAEVGKLLDYGFANYEIYVIAEKGDCPKIITVENGTPKEVNAVTDRKITVLAEKGKTDEITSKVTLNQKVKLPLQKGDEVGKIAVYKGEEKIGEYPLVAEEEVKKAPFFQLVKRLFDKLI